jgi:hypothetical protein
VRRPPEAWHWRPIPLAATVALVGEHYGLVLVPNTVQRNQTGPSGDDIVAQRQREGWQLISTRVDSEGAELIVFRRPA